MTIKAILRDGHIQPLEPLPADWVDGEELLIEIQVSNERELEIREWAQDLEDAAAQLPAEEHDRFCSALNEVERESKEAVRREWGLA